MVSINRYYDNPSIGWYDKNYQLHIYDRTMKRSRTLLRTRVFSYTVCLGTYNTAPSSSMSSVKLLQVGATYTWQIPVADTDGDIVRCRWAKRGPPDECAQCVFHTSFFVCLVHFE